MATIPSKPWNIPRKKASQSGEAIEPPETASPTSQTLDPEKLDRREFLRRGFNLAATGVAGTLAGAAVANLGYLAVKNYEVELAEARAAANILKNAPVNFDLADECRDGNLDKVTSSQFDGRNKGADQVKFYTSLKAIIDDPAPNLNDLARIINENQKWIITTIETNDEIEDLYKEREGGAPLAKAVAYTLSTNHDKKTKKAIIDTIANNMALNPNNFSYLSTDPKVVIQPESLNSIEHLAQYGFIHTGVDGSKKTIIEPEIVISMYDTRHPVNTIDNPFDFRKPELERELAAYQRQIMRERAKVSRTSGDHTHY